MTTPSALWVKVIDISRNQGNVDFVKMYSTGIRCLIIRVSHGQTIDDRWFGYYVDAIEAGFDPANIAVYTFINPKRGTGTQCARATVAEIDRALGHTRIGYMLDVENYKQESPNVGTAPVYGAAFAAHIREHIGYVEANSDAYLFGYSNLAYWNGPVGNGQVWVGDDQLASEIEWLPARYPAYSDAAYQHYGYPPAPDGWPDWAYKAQPQGPLPPRGGKTHGWQFSAGWNRQGATYGATSRDLDLNIVLPDAWARWTGHNADTGPTEDDMPAFISNKFAGKYGSAPSPQGGCTIWELVHNSKKALSFEAWIGYGQPFGIALDDSILDGIPDWVESSGVVDQVARDAAESAAQSAERNARALSDVRMGGQRIADAGGH